ncbi:MAG TPA: NAD-dependent epimerase/dehydratase family protein [Actinomycetota bacterium]|jgi:UDP-glucose 4-epimerase
MQHHQPARVLVTGGAGFIGSHLVERLVGRGDDVVVVDDLRNAGEVNLAAVADRIALVRGDCARAAALLGEQHFDLIFHLAAPAYVPPSVDDPIGDLRANVEQTLLLLEALRGAPTKPRLIHVSSAAVYGQPNLQPIREECPPAPVSPYGVDKFAAEEHVRVAATLHGIRAVTLRYFPVYGPRQRKQVVYDLINKMRANPEQIEVYGSGRELRDLCFVDDIVSGTIVAADRAPARGEACNVGSGTMVSIAELVAEISRAMRLDPEIAFTGSVRPGDSERMVADIARLRALGYEPRVSLSEGIRRTVGWVTGVAPADEGAVA